MQLPDQLIDSLQGTRGFNKDAFEKIHSSRQQITSIRINQSKPVTQLTNKPINQLTKIPWTEYGYYLDTRPSFTFDPLFHAGCYYVQEASSMFLEQALKQTIDIAAPLRVLDLCAAPGGKSTHIQSLLSKDSLLVSNDVIRSRGSILKDNIIKWGSENVIVTNNDPKDFARLENYFDVIVVDVPCSGSGLFRRQPEAIDEWSKKNVQLCSQRQQRILADVWPALKKDGILIYSTCSYSKEEDEDIVNWLMQELQIDNCQLSIANDWGIIESSGGYRFWPDKVQGEGFFIASFRKKDGDDFFGFKSVSKPVLFGKKELEKVKEWLVPCDNQFIRRENTIYALPAVLLNDISFLSASLHVIYPGIETGEWIRDKMIPAHALAMSGLVSKKLQMVNLDLDTAVNFLKKKNIHIDPVNKGWNLVTYKGCNLGWVNVLSNRVNNYYPKSLRILKDN